MDDAEEPDKTGENKTPSKFQSVGVQVEEEKWWVHIHMSSFVLMLESMLQVFFPMINLQDSMIFSINFWEHLEGKLESINISWFPPLLYTGDHSI